MPGKLENPLLVNSVEIPIDVKLYGEYWETKGKPEEQPTSFVPTDPNPNLDFISPVSSTVAFGELDVIINGTNIVGLNPDVVGMYTIEISVNGGVDYPIFIGEEFLIDANTQFTFNIIFPFGGLNENSRIKITCNNHPSFYRESAIFTIDNM